MIITRYACKFWLDGVDRQELLRLVRKQAKGDELTD